MGLIAGIKSTIRPNPNQGSRIPRGPSWSFPRVFFHSAESEAREEGPERHESTRPKRSEWREGGEQSKPPTETNEAEVECPSRVKGRQNESSGGAY